MRAGANGTKAGTRLSFPVGDNIIPICDDNFFDDDITGLFCGKLGGNCLRQRKRWKKTSSSSQMPTRRQVYAYEVIRSYFLNDFYADHLKSYQKRPIYWLFDSGKRYGFRSESISRYQVTFLPLRMRTDYVHEQQERYRAQLTLADAIEHAGAAGGNEADQAAEEAQEQARDSNCEENSSSCRSIRTSRSTSMTV